VFEVEFDQISGKHETQREKKHSVDGPDGSPQVDILDKIGVAYRAWIEKDNTD
jgi:hypothetical protein